MNLFFGFFFKCQSEQRQRAGRMTVNDLKEYLHLPISEAAKKMNLCLTVVKKICRRSGLRRWPYRKVLSFYIISGSPPNVYRNLWFFLENENGFLGKELSEEDGSFGDEIGIERCRDEGQS